MSLNQDFLQNDFERVFQDERLKTDVIYQGQSFWKDVWHRFIQNKGALFGFIMINLVSYMICFGLYEVYQKVAKIVTRWSISYGDEISIKQGRIDESLK